MEHDLYLMLAENIRLAKENNDILTALFEKLKEEEEKAKGVVKNEEKK